MITEEQFQIIKDRYYSNPAVVNKSKTKDEYDVIRSFEGDFIITEDGASLTFNIPNKGRYDNKVKEANQQGKKLELKNVIKPNQISYRCMNKKSKYYGVNFTQAYIDEEILRILEKFKIGNIEHEKYVEFINTKLDEIIKSNREKQYSINLEIGRVRKQKDEYIRKNMSRVNDDEEKRIYNETRDEYDRKIKVLNNELQDIDTSERNEIVELEVFKYLINNSKSYYKRANYVQKRKISKLLFSNIKIDHEKRLQIQVKPELKALFNVVWYSKHIQMRHISYLVNLIRKDISNVEMIILNLREAIS